MLISCVFIYMSLAFALSCLTNRRIEETLAPTAFSMIIILYISGLCQNLLFGEYTLIVFSLIAFIFILYTLAIRHNWSKIKLIVTPGGLAFLICLILNVIINKDRGISGWDEFSHWGRVVLNMFQWNKLGNCEGSTVMFMGYPPGISLWEYFFVCLKDKFVESYLYISCNLLITSLLIPVFKKVEWKQWEKIIVLFGVVLLMPLIFFEGLWSMLYADGILGIWMIYILFAHFSEKKNTPFKMWQINMALMTYPLVKEAGVGLAFLAVFIIGMDVFVCDKKNLKKIFIMLLSYAASIFVGKQSWTWYLKLTDTAVAWNSSDVSLEKIINLLNGSAETWQYDTIKAFIRAFLFGINKERTVAFGGIFILVCLAIFFNVVKIRSKKQILWYLGGGIFCETVYIGLATYVIKTLIGSQRWQKYLEEGCSKAGILVSGWIVIIVLFSFLIYRMGIWSKKQFFCYSGSFVICIVIYAVSMLIVYCFTFGSYEGPRLASYERYMASILLGIFGYVVSMLASESTRNVEKITLMILLCLMIPVSSLKNYTINLRGRIQSDMLEKAPYENIKEFADFMDWNQDKVYFIDQGSNGRSRIICSYNATPICFAPEWGWSLGEPLFEGDVWTVNYSIQEWEEILKTHKYTYVYLYHQDQQFVDNYKELFENPDEIKDRVLYQVCENSEGKIFLKSYKEY